MSISEWILSITGLFIGWQALETRRLVKWTRIQDQPLLDIEFQDNGAEILLTNNGRSAAYSLAIQPLEISRNEFFHFDPFHNSRTPIQAGEKRNVWMHHVIVEQGSVGGFVESMPALRNKILNMNKDASLAIYMTYFDQRGRKLSRVLYIKISGNQATGNQHIYTSTAK